MKLTAPISITIILTACLSAQAECPLDHFIIGCNRDGIAGTADDRTLFVDCEHKYRDSGDAEYANWFYPLRLSIFPSYPYRIGEPGFDVFQSAGPGDAYDPNCALAGVPDLDYQITVEYLALSAGLRAVHKDYPPFTIDAAGQTFNHSQVHNERGDPHIHMSYQAMDGERLHWITFRVYDALADDERYQPAEPVTLVFNTLPRAGDLAVDGRVDIADLLELSHDWLSPESSRHNDFCERADTNRDGFVNLHDFARLAANWRVEPNDPSIVFAPDVAWSAAEKK